MCVAPFTVNKFREIWSQEPREGTSCFSDSDFVSVIVVLICISTQNYEIIYPFRPVGVCNLLRLHVVISQLGLETEMISHTVVYLEPSRAAVSPKVLYWTCNICLQKVVRTALWLFVERSEFCVVDIWSTYPVCTSRLSSRVLVLFASGTACAVRRISNICSVFWRVNVTKSVMCHSASLSRFSTQRSVVFLTGSLFVVWRGNVRGPFARSMWPTH